MVFISLGFFWHDPRAAAVAGAQKEDKGVWVVGGDSRLGKPLAISHAVLLNLLGLFFTAWIGFRICPLPGRSDGPDNFGLYAPARVWAVDLAEKEFTTSPGLDDLPDDQCFLATDSFLAVSGGLFRVPPFDDFHPYGSDELVTSFTRGYPPGLDAVKGRQKDTDCCLGARLPVLNSDS